MTAGLFFAYALMTALMCLSGLRSIMQRDYYLGAVLIAIPAVGWLTVALRAYGWLT